ncbi:MAG: DUF1566 domain-containing protein [Phycisphaerae bacterium]|nr:DUF1566 domain-containing protein [Saprospiraceae bacterium]
MQSIALSIFSLLLLSFAAQAQAPQAFKYQAVVRNAAGQLLANQNVGLKIELLGPDTLYSEVHSVTTNAFGLVNLNIGKGTPVSGNFSQITWGQQPIFVVISLDASGGTNYQYMGGSELLSVPYALYAANAGGGGGLPANAQTGDIVYYDGTAWQGLPAGAAGTVLTMGTDGKPIWQALSQLDSLIKMTMTNGDVIYAYPSDNSNNSTGAEWGGYGTDITGLANITNTATANMDFNGEANTALIVTQTPNPNGTLYAAKLCAELVAYGFDDWYLPAAGELNEMYKKLGPVANGGSGQITTGDYWSSSEFGHDWAWHQIFTDGVQSHYVKNYHFRCRCVRR